MAALGGVLRSRRVELGLSQAQLAGRCGISRPTIIKIEAAEEQCRLGNFFRLAKGVGLTPQELLERIFPKVETDDPFALSILKKAAE
jgi:transcriptional regulator with XRE-family HTH domain